jgi:hypothetical protein
VSRAAHRARPIPWLARLGCWLWGHEIEQTGMYAWHCTRCDRCARTPVQLP